MLLQPVEYAQAAEENEHDGDWYEVLEQQYDAAHAARG